MRKDKSASPFYHKRGIGSAEEPVCKVYLTTMRSYSLSYIYWSEHPDREKSKISVVTVEKKVNFIIDLNFSFLFCSSDTWISHISKGEEDSMRTTSDLYFWTQITPLRYLKVSHMGSEIRDSGTLGVRETSPRHFWVPCPLNQI